MKNDIDPADRDQPEQQLCPVHFLAGDQWFKQSSEKADGGKANQRYRYIGIFDGTIKRYPMHRGNKPHASDTKYIFYRDFLQSLCKIIDHPHSQRGEQKPVPYDHPFVQRDQTAKYTGKAGEENSNMQLKKSFFHEAVIAPRDAALNIQNYCTLVK